jgi:hypothetical protein
VEYGKGMGREKEMNECKGGHTKFSLFCPKNKKSAKS